MGTESMPACFLLFPSGSGYESPGDSGVHRVLPVERALSRVVCHHGVSRVGWVGPRSPD